MHKYVLEIILRFARSTFSFSYLKLPRERNNLINK